MIRPSPRPAAPEALTPRQAEVCGWIEEFCLFNNAPPTAAPESPTARSAPPTAKAPESPTLAHTTRRPSSTTSTVAVVPPCTHCAAAPVVGRERTR